MPERLSCTYVGSRGVYANMRRDTDGYAWDYVNDTAVEWEDNDINNYKIPLSGAGGDLFLADIPGLIPLGEIYRVIYYEDRPNSPSVNDILLWSEVIEV